MTATMIRAFRGEFGLKVYRYVPQVHALCRQEPCVVEVERGEEALFPAAEDYLPVERVPDETRHGAPADLGVEGERFVPEPVETFDLGEVDVVVCPRWRSYGAEKNWSGWYRLTTKLVTDGVAVHAAGAPDSSMTVPCPVAWAHDRFLDASIQMMLATDLVVATDAGLAHLAVLCGADLLVATYRGKVAPGLVVDSSGRVAREEYWTAGRGPGGGEDRFHAANHRGARIEYIDGWEYPERVAEAVEAW